MTLLQAISILSSWLHLGSTQRSLPEGAGRLVPRPPEPALGPRSRRWNGSGWLTESDLQVEGAPLSPRGPQGQNALHYSPYSIQDRGGIPAEDLWGTPFTPRPEGEPRSRLQWETAQDLEGEPRSIPQWEAAQDLSGRLLKTLCGWPCGVGHERRPRGPVSLRLSHNDISPTLFLWGDSLQDRRLGGTLLKTTTTRPRPPEFQTSDPVRARRRL
ncbi:hypothetical protein B0H13DRAFT_521636 [Mycena leptocephala]|nr:hypothetical protein B0H13DRAFT_521636 [Mycena leptocephala]